MRPTQATTTKPLRRPTQAQGRPPATAYSLTGHVPSDWRSAVPR